MYYYVYDQFLAEKKYAPLLAKIETRLTDLEIKGRVGRLSLLNSPRELIENEIKRGAKTIVAVGNDATVSKVVNILAYHDDICLGIIPIGPQQRIARTLGLPESIEACNALASRIIKKIDMGKIKNIYFLSQLEIAEGDVTLQCDNKYTVSLDKKSNAFIYNFNYWSDAHLANPSDGLLETVIVPREGRLLGKLLRPGSKEPSIFLNKRIKIEHRKQPITVKVDSQQQIKTPVLVEIASAQLKVIVGKDRVFV